MYLTNPIKMHELKAKSVHFRRNYWKGKNANSTTELDRVRGEVSRTALHGESRERLLSRQNQLEVLGAEALSGMKLKMKK